jgi:dTDP-4-amino-4,6-dideoxygalactose transaminase
LWQGIQALGLGTGDEILVPAYHHGSEIEALLQAGLTCRFYEATATLAPDPQELERLLSPRTRALYIIHYLGFPQDAGRWRTWCDRRGFLLIEDAAQAWLATVDGHLLGSFGDLAFFCLYKTFGLPDGSALISRRPLPITQAQPCSGIAQLGVRHAEWLMARSGWLTRLGTRRPHPAAGSVEDLFSLGDPTSSPSSATSVLLSRVADREAASRRRLHYQLLLDRLATYVPAPFQHIPAGASPFAFPIETNEKATVLARLTQAGVVALNFWSFAHPSLSADQYANATWRRSRTIGLPVHQELRLEDVERIARVVRDALADRLGTERMQEERV